ncbi:MAG: hypothetical protein ACRCZF_20765 [Gemmataceae bacterium]
MTSPENTGQDRLEAPLQAFFAAEMPKAWPRPEQIRAHASTTPGTASPSRRSERVLAICMAALFLVMLGVATLQSPFVPRQTPRLRIQDATADGSRLVAPAPRLTK